jgi:hypothetical protein
LTTVRSVDKFERKGGSAPGFSPKNVDVAQIYDGFSPR